MQHEPVEQWIHSAASNTLHTRTVYIVSYTHTCTIFLTLTADFTPRHSRAAPLQHKSLSWLFPFYVNLYFWNTNTNFKCLSSSICSAKMRKMQRVPASTFHMCSGASSSQRCQCATLSHVVTSTCCSCTTSRWNRPRRLGPVLSANSQ